jgi:dTDP-4-dehydrorhamnose reductase
MELWGGIECTINRVQDMYMDQLDYSGHYNRPDDIKAFAELGIKKMRYPVLWEKHKPNADSVIDWTHTEQKLQELKQRGVEPIAGLVHHGSGPMYVNMLEDSFANGLAAYAKQVAEKFPWLEYYTPVNEPLTTARFCGLYGLWHPHGTTAESFLRVLLNECKATVLAMQEIRKINPAAKLVQTEDLGKVHSTPTLSYQAKFENHRRWLSFDLLCGKVTSSHPLYKYLLKNGISSDDLQFFIDSPCVPDVLGLNYYPTSERYLDENIDNFPAHTHGSNGRHKYADVEVVRVGNTQPSGPYSLLKEAWERYKLPMAVTEVHLHCTREEQLRWMQYIWNAANKLADEGADVRGVTSWAILGSFGWNRLLTQPNGDYEPGVLDVLSGRPRPTAMSKLLQSWSAQQAYTHPVANGQGWWERDIRIVHNQKDGIPVIKPAHSSAPILIIGKFGALGAAFAKACELRNINYRQLSKTEIDITNREQIEQVIQELKPWAVINTASFLQVDQAETACDSCYLVNTHGPDNLAYFTNKYNIKLLTFSSDMVFDGKKNDYYLENDAVSPLNIYGRSKALAEQCVLKNDPSALIVRMGALFSAWDEQNYVVKMLNQLNARQPVIAEHDLFISPTYIPDLVHTSLNLLIDDESGIWHLANTGKISWAMLAREIAERAGHNVNLIRAVSVNDMDYKAVRPKYSALKSERGMLLPSLDKALNNFFEDLKLIA